VHDVETVEAFPSSPEAFAMVLTRNGPCLGVFDLMREFKPFDTLNDFVKLDYCKRCLVKDVEIPSLPSKYPCNFVRSRCEQHRLSAHVAKLRMAYIR
jgi:hypothetical protein